MNKKNGKKQWTIEKATDEFKKGIDKATNGATDWEAKKIMVARAEAQRSLTHHLLMALIEQIREKGGTGK